MLFPLQIGSQELSLELPRIRRFKASLRVLMNFWGSEWEGREEKERKSEKGVRSGQQEGWNEGERWEERGQIVW